MSRRAKLAELRALKASGKTRLSTYEVHDEEQLYEEVGEEDYKKIVRKRLDQDDFVIDDNGEGYADDGREDWMHERRQIDDTDSEDELPAKGKAGLLFFLNLYSIICSLFSISGKRKREEEQQKNDSLDRGIRTYFSNGPAAAQAKAKVRGSLTTYPLAFSDLFM